MNTDVGKVNALARPDHERIVLDVWGDVSAFATRQGAGRVLCPVRTVMGSVVDGTGAHIEMMKAAQIAVLLALIGPAGGFAFAGDPPAAGGLAPCPSSPNCVSSQAADEGRRVAPLRYSDAEADARKRLLVVLRGMDGAQVRQDSGDYIHVEFRSAVFGFVDDVTFRFEPAGEIQLRSASRAGYYDFGVNRRRVEAIRSGFSR